MDVGIVGQRGNSRAVSIAGELRERLRDYGADVWLDEVTAEAMAADRTVTLTPPAERTGEANETRADRRPMSECDLGVSIGGDGTFLFAARAAGTTPVMGVNLGEVGFLNAVSPEESVEVVLGEVERIETSGEPRVQTLPRLVATGEDWRLPAAINEVVVQGRQRGHGNGVGIEVRVDGSLYTGGRADGVLAATPTGSTAYNLSEGGPLVQPGVGAMVVTEMCADEPMPPLVTEPGAELTIRVEAAPEAVAISDGRTQRALDPPEQVTLRLDEEPLRLAGPPLDFFTALGKLD